MFFFSIIRHSVSIKTLLLTNSAEFRIDETQPLPHSLPKRENENIKNLNFSSRNRTQNLLHFQPQIVPLETGIVNLD